MMREVILRYRYILVFIFFRIYLGELTGVWFPSDQAYDDALLVQYALSTHYQYPNHLTLLKTMSFPWFLDLVYISQLNYTLVLSLLWCLAAILIFRFLYKNTNNVWISFFFFLYVLFMPTAFELWMGTRLYRNAIIAPFVIIVFYFMVSNIFLVCKNKSFDNKRFFISSIIFGLFFTFSFYIKEDGIWLLMCLISSIILCSIIIVVRMFFSNQKCRLNNLISIFLLFLPLLIFGVGTNVYKYINYQFTGVSAIETRTQGELGRFVKYIYKIDSDNRTSIHWAPADAIDKAYNVSTTFQKYPELRNKIIHTPWFGHDAYVTPIKGDFLTWVLRTALIESNVWNSEKQVNDIFYNINNELEMAFNDGRLIKDTKRIQITSSMGGRTYEEINKLFSLVGKIYKGSVFLRNYSAGSVVGNVVNPEIAQKASELTRIHYFTDYSKMEEGIVDIKKANKIINLIFKVYRIINTILFFLAFFMIIYPVLFSLFNTKMVRENFSTYVSAFLFSGGALAFILLSLVYSLAIAWFSEFIFTEGINMTILNFYSVANSVLLMFFYILGVMSFRAFLRTKVTI